MRRTGLVYHQNYLLHDAGPSHPESGERIKRTVEHLRKTGLLEKLIAIKPQPCTDEDVLRVHTKELFNLIKDTSRSGGGEVAEDTFCGAGSFDAALLAAGGCIEAGKAVMEKRVDNAYALIRPPGHHAMRSKAGGFCFFNNAAIMIRYLQNAFGLKRIFIFDWDAHAGNGTMDIFYDDPSVLNISIHQDPRGFYPHTGFVEQTGKQEGDGFTVNIPVPAGTKDIDYIHLLKEFVLPVMREYKPEFAVIAAGQDSHTEDPMSDISLTEAGYYEMTKLLASEAEKVCCGRLVVELEGGYDLDSFPAANQAIIEALLGVGEKKYKIEGLPLESTDEVLNKLNETLLPNYIASKAP
jgi:acetoin utilization deacetylase AcuC-like enzyme